MSTMTNPFENPADDIMPWVRNCEEGKIFFVSTTFYLLASNE